MPTLVQFGAGNIGRSFIGQLFARGGYEVVFVDVDPVLVNALNSRRSYVVEIADTPPGEILVENVRAVDGRDKAAVVAELARADLAATAVGANALRHLYPVIAAGLEERRLQNSGPLDIILCENLHHAASIVRDGLKSQLPPEFPLEDAVGLVETSIGKMVPLMPAGYRERDPLLVRAEAYNTLIVDGKAFKNPVPDIPGLSPKGNMAAYVDRKLYIHNLGHAAIAYECARLRPDIHTIGEAVLVPEVRDLAQAAMGESARALNRAYPEEFTLSNLEEHIADLLRRFANPALGDTIFRVGRDVRRKLSRHDRIIGAMLLDLQHGIVPGSTAAVAAAAFGFQATGENGEMDPSDRAFIEEDLPRGPEYVLETVCGLNPANPPDQQAWKLILDALSRRY